ncbi:hypothetical protein BJX68DRAFT_217544 [Aspergillus pseudodeflectus]|uniref:Uncharacterized protein n=1 Tax=Aspergillus pseudodeflectus TaxID=176178 RepID=A0ABR4KTQ7_9EURO
MPSPRRPLLLGDDSMSPVLSFRIASLPLIGDGFCAAPGLLFGLVARGRRGLRGDKIAIYTIKARSPEMELN